MASAIHVPHHLRFINDYYQTRNTDAVFTLFPKLPTELRLHIWKLSVTKQRLVEIELHCVDDDLPPADSRSRAEALPAATNALGKALSNGRYIAVVRNSIQLHSKLLRVNREARQAALEFCRIHIPCILLSTRDLLNHLKAGDRGYPDQSVAQTPPQPLYLNPEHDILFLKAHPPAQQTLVSFIHDLCAYDPRGTGLLRVAFERNTISNLELAATTTTTPVDNTAVPSSTAAVNVWASFVSTLSRFHEIIYMMDAHVGRAIIGQLIDVPAAGVRFNHSLPVKPMTSTFDFAPDPRPKDQVIKDLSCVVAISDPHGMREQIANIFSACGISREELKARVKERVLLAYSLPSYMSPITDGETAQGFLCNEHDTWLRGQRARRFWIARAGKKVPVETDEELQRVARPAIGFWLFDADKDVFGPIDQSGMYTVKRALDLSGEWPELALARLL